MSAHRWVRKVWAGQGGVSGALVRTLLRPAEVLFGLGLRVRERRYAPGRGRVVRASIPVVSVGNLSVGGTGKTPVASWVIRVLRAEGTRPALVLRGYGEDELRLHRRWTADVPVVADADRHAGVEEAARGGAGVAVLDDGFQHRRLARDIDLVLVGAEEGLPGALLPRGPFREPLSALRRAHGVIVTRKDAPAGRARELAEEVRREVPDVPVAILHLRPGGFRSLVDGTPLEAPDGPVMVASGVARPESVAAAVRALDVEVAQMVPFPDHHAFTEAEAEALVVAAGDRPLVVTEKDAVKLEDLKPARRGDVRVLLQEMVWEEGREALETLVKSVLESRTT